MTYTLMALKISPDDILPLLCMINSNVGDRKHMENCVLEYYKKTSKSLTSPHHNPLRTRVVHSLRKLQLLQGEGLDINLTPEGTHLVFTKPENYKKELAKMILRIDNKTCHIIDLIKKIDGCISYKSMVTELRRIGIVVKNTDDKLRRWLQFLTYCGIIQYESSLYKLNSEVVDALNAKSEQIPLAQFEKILYEEYYKIKKLRGAYVPIPIIKSAVSGRLKDKGFVPWDFQDYLIKTIQSNPTKIVLSETGVRQEGGIFHNKVYYHFVTIY